MASWFGNKILLWRALVLMRVNDHFRSHKGGKWGPSRRVSVAGEERGRQVFRDTS